MIHEPLPILLYHSVAPDCDPRFAEWTVTPERFSEQMAFLAENGYQALTVRELVRQVFERQAPISPRTVVITFDDGFADFHRYAWPEMSRHGLTATVYIATGYVGATSTWLAHTGEADRPMMSWDQVTELDSAGIECAAHGDRHLQLDTVSAAVAAEDMKRSKAALEQVIGPVDSFAYPHGYYTRRLQRQVADAGFSSACAVRDALSSSVDDPYALARLVIRGETGIDDFARLVSGEALVAPRNGILRRGAWRALRRTGAEPIVHRLRSRESAHRGKPADGARQFRRRGQPPAHRPRAGDDTCA